MLDLEESINITVALLGCASCAFKQSHNGSIHSPQSTRKTIMNENQKFLKFHLKCIKIWVTVEWISIIAIIKHPRYPEKIYYYRYMQYLI
jgi:hypothetical protein